MGSLARNGEDCSAFREVMSRLIGKRPIDRSLVMFAQTCVAWG